MGVDCSVQKPEYDFPIRAADFKAHIEEVSGTYFKMKVQKILDRTKAAIEKTMKENKYAERNIAKPNTKVFVDVLGDDSEAMLKAASAFLTSQGFVVAIQRGDEASHGYLLVSV